MIERLHKSAFLVNRLCQQIFRYSMVFDAVCLVIVIYHFAQRCLHWFTYKYMTKKSMLFVEWMRLFVNFFPIIESLRYHYKTKLTKTQYLSTQLFRAPLIETSATALADCQTKNDISSTSSIIIRFLLTLPWLRIVT